MNSASYSMVHSTCRQTQAICSYRDSLSVIEQLVPLIKFDKNLSITMLNNAFSAISGYTADELAKVGGLEVLFESCFSEFKKVIAHHFPHNDYYKCEFGLRRSDGHKRWLSMTISSISPTHDYFLAIFEDHTDKKLFKRASETDHLTGLYNRQKIESYLLKYLPLSQEDLFIALIDIDHFKKINDTFGHLYGDTVLKELTPLLHTFSTPHKDYVGRWGGEEFLAIFTQTTFDEVASRLEIFRAKVESHVFSVPLCLSVSIGWGRAYQNDTIDSLLYKTDLALYSAKENGRNRIVMSYS